MKRIVAIALCFCISAQSFGAIAVDSQESAGAGHRGTVSPLTWSFNNVAGTKLVCGFVATVQSANPTVAMSTPTYNGASMTLAGSQKGWDTVHSITAVFYLDGPATGTNTVSLAATIGLSILGGCISFTGAATGIGTVTNGTAASGTIAKSGSITTATGNYIFANGGWGNGAGGTANSSFTRTYLTNGSTGTAGDDILGEYFSSTGTIKVPAFTWTVSDQWGIVAVEITAAAATTPTCPSVIGSGVICGSGI